MEGGRLVLGMRGCVGHRSQFLQTEGVAIPACRGLCIFPGYEGFDAQTRQFQMSPSRLSLVALSSRAGLL